MGSLHCPIFGLERGSATSGGSTMQSGPIPTFGGKP